MISGVSPRTRRSAWRLRRNMARIFSGRNHSLPRNHSPYGRRMTQPCGRPVHLALANWQRRRVYLIPIRLGRPSVRVTGNAASSGHSRCSHARRVGESRPHEARADFAAASMPKWVPKPGGPGPGPRVGAPTRSQPAVCDLTQVPAALQPDEHNGRRSIGSSVRKVQGSRPAGPPSQPKVKSAPLSSGDVTLLGCTVSTLAPLVAHDPS
jgi:hypothetical protein